MNRDEWDEAGDEFHDDLPNVCDDCGNVLAFCDCHEDEDD